MSNQVFLTSIVGETANATSDHRIDLHESGEGNEITAMFELPGMSKDDVIIEVQNNYLTVSGETKFAKDVEEDGYVLKERRRGKFTRTLPLPTDIKAEQIKASIEHGVLTVTFRKSAPEPASKRVAIL